MPTILILGAIALGAVFLLSRRAGARERDRNVMPNDLQFMLKQSVVQASATGNAALLNQTGQELIRRGFPESGNRILQLGTSLQQSPDQDKLMLAGATTNDAANVDRGQQPQFLPELARQFQARADSEPSGVLVSLKPIYEDMATLANLTAIYLVEAGAEGGTLPKAA